MIAAAGLHRLARRPGARRAAAGTGPGAATR